MPTINYQLNDEDFNNELNDYAKDQFKNFIESYGINFDTNKDNYTDLYFKNFQHSCNQFILNKIIELNKIIKEIKNDKQV